MTTTSAVSSESINASLENFEPTISFSYAPSPQEVETHVRKPVHERVKEIKPLGASLSTYVIDGCLNLIDVSSTEYVRTIEYRKTLETVAKIGRIVSLIGLTSSAIEIAAATFKKNRSYQLIGLTHALFFGGLTYLFYRILPSSSQRILSLPLLISQGRQSAYRAGFTFVFHHQLKHSETSRRGIIHADEARFFYFEYLKKWCQETLSTIPSNEEEKAVWMHTFFIYNPLSAALMEYGLGSLPKEWKEITEEYAQLVKSLKEPTYESLRVKFESSINHSKLDRTSNPTSNEVKDLIAEAQKFRLANLQRIKALNLKYRKKLNEKEISFQFLKERFEYELRSLQIDYFSKLLHLQEQSKERLKHMENPSAPQPQTPVEWYEPFFIEALKTFKVEQDEDLIQLYPAARALLEKASKLIS